MFNRHSYTLEYLNQKNNRSVLLIPATHHRIRWLPLCILISHSASHQSCTGRYVFDQSVLYKHLEALRSTWRATSTCHARDSVIFDNWKLFDDTTHLLLQLTPSLLLVIGVKQIQKSVVGHFSLYKMLCSDQKSEIAHTQIYPSRSLFCATM